jgi:ubiquinone/menaquinone biosynthesis C-methylase UbiE
VILNLGCGDDEYGDIRVDIFRTKTSNLLSDCQHLPFREGSIGGVYERNVFEHLPNPAQHLEEVKRVLSPKGRLTLITDNAACVKFYLLGTHTGGYRKHDGKDVHYAVFTLEHMRNFMAFVGLTVLEMKLVDTDYYTRFFDRFVRLLAPSLSYPRIVVEAEKP